KVLDGGINHMVIATYRLGISSIFLFPIAYFWERKTRPKLTTSILCQLFVSALFGASLMQYFYLLGMSYTSATLASAFMGTIPALTFIMALIFGFEKLNMKTKFGYGVILGAMISLAGALMLTMYQGIPLSNSQEQATISNIQTAEVHVHWIKGCFLLFTGITLFSSWMLIQAKINASYPCPYSSTVILSVFAFFPVVLMSATVFDFVILHRMVYLGSVIGSVVVVMGLYIFLWSKSKQTVDCKIIKLPTNTVEVEKEEEDHTNAYKLGRLLVIPMTP
ncbi:unnamed protein product, partial [Thlaspi arvense]